MAIAVNYLSRWDLALLDRHTAFYRALEQGKRLPSTPLQAHFVAMCQQLRQATTQHEIAYHRLKNGWIDPRMGHSPIFEAHASTAPDIKVERVVDWLDATRLSFTSPFVVDASTRVTKLYRSGAARASRASADVATWMTAVLSDPGVEKSLIGWTSQEFGRLSDVYTRALDGSFANGLVSGEHHVSPWLHRLFDGHHTLVGAWQPIRDALPDDTLAEEFVGYLKALGSDLATSIGLPLMTITPQTFEALRAFFCDQLGVSRAWLIDAMHFNGVELVAAAVPIAAALLGWTMLQGEAFARMAGALGIGAFVAANPLAAIVAIGMLAKAYTDISGHPAMVRGVVEGGATAGIVIGTGSVIGGPIWVGLLVGIALAIALRQGVKRGPQWLQDGAGAELQQTLASALEAVRHWTPPLRTA